ncbi:hypothetical protein [Nocardia noduli]|uniref:hypothetical protein n=1 Tax=Nocardia noduli TaxID=2815722 RepID=UPI001C22E617|nr:hypothetical protein [Nocardia noduli]
MAGDDFRIDTDQVGAQAAKFGELAGELTTGLTDLVAGLSAIGDAWGEDEFGERFAANYVDKADDALTNIATAVQMFQFLEKGTEVTANTFGALDADFTSVLTTITSRLDGTA